MTVSRVINGDAKVKASTRDKVQASIERLNYSPNISARNLAGAKSLRICLLFGNPSSAYLGELLMGALQAASDVGAHLVVERTDASVTPKQIASNLRTSWDALIVPPPISDVAGIRRLVLREGIPTVFLSSAALPGRANEIRIDDRAAARNVAELLLARGHRRVGFIKGHPNQTVSEERFLGYKDAIAAAGLEFEANLVAQGFFSYRSGMDAGEELLALKAPPTAIFASNDDMAAGLMAAASVRGLLVPRDLSVVGFDDSPIATTVWPNLTTVRQPVAEMAAEAVKLIQKIWRDKSAASDPQTLIDDYQIVERETVSSPRS